jgi:hypothetical protein
MSTTNFVQEEINLTLSDVENCKDLFILLGEINLSIIASSIVIIENKLVELNFPKSIISRTKLIAIELLDNILKHQLKNSEFKPFFKVIISDENIKFVSGNCISLIDFEILNKKLKTLSSLKPKEIQDVYMRNLKKNELDIDGNAGLGLLTIMKKNKIEFNYDLIKLSNNCYFYKNRINLLKVK